MDDDDYAALVRHGQGPSVTPEELERMNMVSYQRTRRRDLRLPNGATESECLNNEKERMHALLDGLDGLDNVIEGMNEKITGVAGRVAELESFKSQWMNGDFDAGSRPRARLVGRGLEPKDFDFSGGGRRKKNKRTKRRTKKRRKTRKRRSKR